MDYKESLNVNIYSFKQALNSITLLILMQYALNCAHTISFWPANLREFTIFFEIL